MLDYNTYSRMPPLACCCVSTIMMPNGTVEIISGNIRKPDVKIEDLTEEPACPNRSER